MGFQHQYDALIKNASKRGLDKSNVGFYTEAHHIIPECMGGLSIPENYVLLSGAEHYTAHKLLAKIYPDNYGLQHAWWAMSNQTDSSGRDYKITAEEYEAARIAFSKAHSKLWADAEFKTRVINSQKERWKRDRARLLKSLEIGLLCPETVEKRKNSLKLTLKNPSIREKYSKASKLSLSRPEVKDKLSKKSLEWFSDSANKMYHSSKIKEALKTDSVKEKLSESSKRSMRKQPIWHSPMKEELYEIWININKPNESKFRKYVASIGYPDVNYVHMVNNYFKKGITI